MIFRNFIHLLQCQDNILIQSLSREKTQKRKTAHNPPHQIKQFGKSWSRLGCQKPQRPMNMAGIKNLIVVVQIRVHDP